MKVSNELKIPKKIGKEGGQRFFHLDALRGSLMVWGIAVHISTLNDSSVFNRVAQFSGFVRMEAFFIASGFLSMMLVGKYGAGATLKKRMISIGVPFLSSVILLNPMTVYLIFVYHNGPLMFSEFLKNGIPPDHEGTIVWHLHLWFLVALFCYGVATLPFVWVTKKLSIVVDLPGVKSRPQVQYALVVAFIVFACCFSRVCFEALFDGRIFPFVAPEWASFTIRSVMHYAPFFILGMLLYKVRTLFVVFSKPHWLHVAASIALMITARSIFSDLPKLSAELLMLVSESYLAVTISSFLFWAFERIFSSPNKKVRYLSEACYTVYLFHYLTIYIVAFITVPLLGDSDAVLWGVAVVVFTLTLAIHEFVVLRFPLLRFLFNGKKR